LTRKAKRSAAPTPISLREYAKRRGVSVEAVSKAITAGRLAACVVKVGRAPKIADPELADREWDANTRPRVDQPSAHARIRPTPRRALPDVHDPEPAEAVDAADIRDIVVPDYFISRALREAAAARRAAALADIAELDVQVRKGELVAVDEARGDVIERFTVVKTKILGVPSRVKQRLPHVSADDVRVIDDFLREALEELADGIGDSDSAEA
jgi:hypothetical protein